MSDPVLLSIQVGLPQVHGTPGGAAASDRPWRTAFYKSPVPGPVPLRRLGLEGDAQADLRVHGGPDKAILAYSADHYPLWREELGEAEMAAGGFGENFTIAGLDEETVFLGDVYGIGGARVQVSQPRQPCRKLARRWGRKDLPRRVMDTGRSGWYFRVLDEGTVAAGLPLRLEERPCPGWSIARVSGVYFEGREPAVLRELGSCPLLAGGWRRRLLERAAQEG